MKRWNCCCGSCRRPCWQWMRSFQKPSTLRCIRPQTMGSSCWRQFTPAAGRICVPGTRSWAISFKILRLSNEITYEWSDGNEAVWWTANHFSRRMDRRSPGVAAAGTRAHIGIAGAGNGTVAGGAAKQSRATAGAICLCGASIGGDCGFLLRAGSRVNAARADGCAR